MFRSLAAVVLFVFSSTALGLAQDSGTYPNKTKTPGATFAVSKDDICVSGYSKKVRNVPVAIHNQAFQDYGITPDGKKYEVDHLISLELGGSNAIENLWPEPYGITWGARGKDKLEDALHKRVCAGTMDLLDAQDAIKTDWVKAYHSVFGANAGPVEAKDENDWLCTTGEPDCVKR